MAVAPKDVIEFFVVTVFFKYLFVHWVGKMCLKLFNYTVKHLIQNERELYIYLHSRNKARYKIKTKAR